MDVVCIKKKNNMDVVECVMDLLDSRELKAK